MSKLRNYYWLLEKEDGRWCIAFGDFSRDVVDAEIADKRDHGVKKKHLRIFTSECSNGGAHMHAAERETERLNATA